MRFSLILYCILFSLLPAIAQQPTREQMQEQLKQAKEEVRQQMVEVEKEIAEAKKKGDDAEGIRELESQLSTLKKMFTGFDKATIGNPRPNIEQPVKVVIPKYNSPITQIPLKQPVTPPTQAKATDKLLWYKGQKIGNNTLVTTSGMVVQYKPQTNEVVLVPDKKKDTLFIRLVDNLSRTGQRKVDFVKGIKNIVNSFMMYPQIEEAYEEFDLLTERYNKIARNTIDLDQAGGFSMHSTPEDPSLSHTGPSAENLMEASWDLPEMYKELLDRLNQPPSLDFPPPPKRPNDLCLCDPTIRKKYELELANWSGIFWKYEDELLRSFKRIQRFLTDNAGTDLSGMPNLNADLNRAIKTAFDRRDQKIIQLMSMYTTDVTREEALVMAVLANERVKQKYGVADFHSASIEQVRDLLSAGHFNRYIDQKILEKDYNVIFDYSLYLSHEFHKQMLGATVDSWNTRYFKWMQLIADFNRFKFSIDMDFEYHKENDDDIFWIADGLMKINPINVRIGRLGCKWQLFLYDVDYAYGKEKEDMFRLPVKVLQGTKKIKKNNKWATYPYSGPANAQMIFPSVRLSFCNGKDEDSLLLDVLRFSDKELSHHYGICKTDFGNMYCLDILQYANSMLVEIVKTKDNNSDLTSLGFEMIAVPANAHAENPTGNAILDQIQIEYSVNLQQHELQKKLGSLSKFDQSAILFDAVNKSPILIDKPADLRNSQVAGAMKLTRANVNIKVVHAPLQQFPSSQIPY